jgi:hypothetical protein
MCFRDYQDRSLKFTTRIWLFFALLITSLFLAGCVAFPPAETTEPSPSATLTFTPDPCTGWDCTIIGVVYEGTVGSGREVNGAVVKLMHTSYCSPTKGEQEMVTGEDGTFEFKVFLHDTDGFRIEVELEGYQTGEYSFGGFDCLFCSCPPIEIVLEGKK